MKLFVTPESLREDSYALAQKFINDGFIPDFMVAIWRGGAPIGCHVHELIKYCGYDSDHIAIRTSRYIGIDKTNDVITVHNLGYLIEKLNKTSKVILIDDVYDTGLSIKAVIETFKEKLGNNMPDDMRIGTIYFKPLRNRTNIIPNYFVHESNEWIVFPHELEGLSLDEINKSMGPKIAEIVATTNTLK